MTKPAYIRVATTITGDIEASHGMANRLVIDRRTGEVLSSTVREGTDMFRWLVTRARTEVSK